MLLDPRINAFRADLAAEHLRGKVDAQRFVAGRALEVVEPIAAVRRAASHTAALDTQALMGERVTVYERTQEGWAWGQLASDGYVGWLSANALGLPGPEPTHKVIALRTLGFPAPDIKLPPAVALPMGARVAVANEDERFAITTAGVHLPVKHLAPLDSSVSDFVAVAERFLGSPYLWGGKTSLGTDCSGLVQIALQAAGIACPRDSDMQAQALGTAVPLDALKRGDFVFWKGHVAIARDHDTLVHANAHHMMVAIEPVGTALARIEAAGTPLIGTKRL
jgi:cell wall-associated NlpC family hydrolase